MRGSFPARVAPPRSRLSPMAWPEVVRLCESPREATVLPDEWFSVERYRKLSKRIRTSVGCIETFSFRCVDFFRFTRRWSDDEYIILPAWFPHPLTVPPSTP